MQIFQKLSPADQVAYNRALLGENSDATFAVGLELENFSRCGGCTLKAIEQVFKPEQLKGTYYNPKDALDQQGSADESRSAEIFRSDARRQGSTIIIRMRSNPTSGNDFMPSPAAKQCQLNSCRPNSKPP